jgi:hypothetical protein
MIVIKCCGLEDDLPQEIREPRISLRAFHGPGSTYLIDTRTQEVFGHTMPGFPIEIYWEDAA